MTTQRTRLQSLPSLKEDIVDILYGIQSHTSFAFGKPIEDPCNPGLSLSDHGTIGLPLSNHDAETIISRSKQSLFGKGTETIVDTAVRKSWELDPSQFSLRNPRWEQMTTKILGQVYEGLGLTCGLENVSAELYKLLLYEEGAFFKPHRDSEKVPGMFGTLIICLSSRHEKLGPQDETFPTHHL